eukprot:1159583-Pelagomonas_calceolata.AAC.3
MEPQKKTLSMKGGECVRVASACGRAAGKHLPFAEAWPSFSNTEWRSAHTFSFAFFDKNMC